MSEAENEFHKIINIIPHATLGKLFGAQCIKASNGKAIAVLWKDALMFKLDEASGQEALTLSGATVGAHLYAPDRPMKGWVTVPFEHSEKWMYLAAKAIDTALGEA